MASDAYDTALDGLLKGADSAVDWTTDTIKVLLLKTAGFTATHATVSAVLAGSAEEADATNYARATLDNPTVAESGGTVTYDADDETFESLGGATNNDIVAAVIYKEVTNDADSIPLFYVDFTDTATNGGDWTLQFHANGIYTIS